MSTLTRGEAEQLIEDCHGKIGALRALSVHWIGHEQEGCDADDIEGLLYEYIDENAAPNEGKLGPDPSDPTDLTDYDSEPTDEQRERTRIENMLTQLSGLLEAWCAAQGLPFGCAGELRATRRISAPQREWLDAFCTLWDVTMGDRK